MCCLYVYHAFCPSYNKYFCLSCEWGFDNRLIGYTCMCIIFVFVMFSVLDAKNFEILNTFIYLFFTIFKMFYIFDYFPEFR